MNHTIDGSMNGLRRIDVLNEAIVDLFAEVYKGNRTTVRVNLSVISFNTAPCLNFPLQDINPGVTMRPLKAGGATELGKALNFFNERLTIDEGRRGSRLGYRPVAFVITDGHPTDTLEDRREACARLATRPKPSLPPRIVPCVVGEPCDDLLDTLTAFYGKDLTSISERVILDGKDVAQSIRSTFGSIAMTLNYYTDDQRIAMTQSTNDEVARMDTIFVNALNSSNSRPSMTFDTFFAELL
jgi:von willebrand factor type A domain